MYIIVGLGNPGEEYVQTRHNVGFMVLDKLREKYGSRFKKGHGPYFQEKALLINKPVLLVKPATYMNLSGNAVRHIVDYYKITDFAKILIILDDFNIPFGSLRLKPNGSAGGQNGLNSIFQALHTRQIPRLRIGIGNSQVRPGSDAKSFVLSRFNKREQKELPEVIEWAANAAESFIEEGIEATMNQYNRNIFDNKKP